ncbi:MAG: hypothetical protein H6687_02950 [Bacillales bacterium]|nr:hypothetical protein [Bacillales bacterium]
MPYFIYIVMFTSIVLSGLYIVFSKSTKPHISLIFKILSSLSFFALSVASALAVLGGIYGDELLFIILMLASVFVAFASDLFNGLTSDGLILKKANKTKVNVASEIVFMASLGLAIAASIILLGFSYYTLIFWLILLILFYYVNVAINKTDFGKNKTFVLIYGAFISFILAQSIGALIFNSVSDGSVNQIALFLTIGYSFVYFSDIIKFNDLFAVKKGKVNKKEEESSGYFDSAFYYIGMLLIALSIAFIFF